MNSVTHIYIHTHTHYNYRKFFFLPFTLKVDLNTSLSLQLRGALEAVNMEAVNHPVTQAGYLFLSKSAISKHYYFEMSDSQIF